VRAFLLNHNTEEDIVGREREMNSSPSIMALIHSWRLNLPLKVALPVLHAGVKFRCVNLETTFRPQHRASALLCRHIIGSIGHTAEPCPDHHAEGAACWSLWNPGLAGEWHWDLLEGLGM
jgi:hypothetical protein